MLKRAGLLALLMAALFACGRAADQGETPITAAPLGTMGSTTRSWVFTRCYADGFDCRIRFENGRYCRDSYNGQNWECFSGRDRYACYCWR